MSLKILNEWPPNILDIAKKFGKIEGFRPVFTHGDTLYNPTGGQITDDLMAHEETHERQQAVLGADQWWSMYLENDTFRLTQEVEAYREQAKFLKTNYQRDYWRPRVTEMARNLSSALYGKIIKIKEAKEIING